MRFSARSSSSARSTTRTSTSVSPASCSVRSRWWPPTTFPVRLFQTIGWTRPHRFRLAASPFLADVEIFRGLYGAGLSAAIGSRS